MANLITFSRIILSISLLMTKPFSKIFLIVYTTCGITDILDGFIARKLNQQSNKGAKLDSIADFIFFIVTVIIVFPNIIQKKIYIIFFVSIAIIRIISIIIVIIKYRKIAILHTYSNKLTGLLLFIVPYFINIQNLQFIINGICIIAFISSIEELIIDICSNKLDRDVKYLNIKKIIKKT